MNLDRGNVMTLISGTKTEITPVSLPYMPYFNGAKEQIDYFYSLPPSSRRSVMMEVYFEQQKDMQFEPLALALERYVLERYGATVIARHYSSDCKEVCSEWKSVCYIMNPEPRVKFVPPRKNFIQRVLDFMRLP